MGLWVLSQYILPVSEYWACSTVGERTSILNTIFEVIRIACVLQNAIPYNGNLTN